MRASGTKPDAPRPRSAAEARWVARSERATRGFVASLAAARRAKPPAPIRPAASHG